MDIIHKDLRKGVAKFRITDLDDLWYLHQIIEPGDLVTGKTTRKIKIGDSENAKAVKKIYILTIEAETIDFGESGTSLRVNGKIKEGPEDIPKESYHAIAIEEGSETTLEKKAWLAHQKKKLEEAAEKKYEYLFCLFDREEAFFALSKKAGYTILQKMKGDVPKKAQAVDVKKDFQQEIIATLENYHSRYHPEKIIVASPAFYKEDLYKQITNPTLKQSIVLATCYDVSEAALDSVVKQPELAKVLKASRIRKEELLMDEVLGEIKTEGSVVYGWKEVLNAINKGAVRLVVMTDKFIQQQRLNKKQQELDQALTHADSMQSEVHILSSDNDPGKKLDGLGGIAALLRYKLWE